MRLWSFLVLLASILWFYLAYHSYCCNGQGNTQFACNTVEEIISPNTDDEERFPLDFKWSNPSAFRNAGFAGFKDDILMGDNDRNVLEIIGYYSPEEKNNTKYDNLGLARAHQIKKLFEKDIPENRIVLKGVVTENTPATREDYFPSADFNWLSPDIISSSEKEAASIDQENDNPTHPKTIDPPTKTVEQLKDKVLIRFPYDSDKKDYDLEVDEYLNKLARRMRRTGELVRLEGHTDDQGSEKYNQWLGMQRAYQIRSILIKKGVSRKQIIPISKGESTPIVPNSSEENRHKNRRVELTITSVEN